MENSALISSLNTLYQSGGASEDPLKRRAWERFAKRPLPKKQDAAFRYVPLHELLRTSFIFPPSSVPSQERIEGALFEEAKESYALFIDGKFSPELSRIPKEIVALPLAQAKRSYGAFLDKQEAISANRETSPFAHLNTALSEEGLFLYLAPRLSIQTPLQFLFIQTGKEDNALLLPRIHLSFGKESRLSLLSKTLSLGGAPSWTNSLLHITLEEGAHGSFFEDRSGGALNWQWSSLRALLKRDSQFSLFALSHGETKGLYRDLDIRLTGENSRAEIKGIEVLKGKSEAHTHVAMGHEAPHTSSNQHVKCVVADAARSGFEGKIFVAQKAQKTDAYQLNNNLILSERAVAYSQPNLEVFADDVKASHGATCSRPNEEQQFYMQTRGFSPIETKRALIRAFCRELVTSLNSDFLRSYCAETIEEMMSEYEA